jgi:hypothetical protein
VTSTLRILQCAIDCHKLPRQRRAARLKPPFHLLKVRQHSAKNGADDKDAADEDAAEQHEQRPADDEACVAEDEGVNMTHHFVHKNLGGDRTLRFKSVVLVAVL